MRKAMTSTVRGGIPVCDKAKKFLKAIEMKFKESEKAETGNFLTALTKMKFNMVLGMYESIFSRCQMWQQS